MTLYDKLINKVPIKTVGIWKNQPWIKHNLQATFEEIGEVECVYIPADRIKNHAPFADRIYNTVEKIRPDLVFSYVNCRHVISEPFLKIRNNLNIPTINIYLDDAHKFKLVSGIAHAFDLNITTCKYALAKYEKQKANAIYLPEGANPNKYVNKNVVKDIDISFVGARYGNRFAVIQALQDKGYKVQVWGKKWPKGKISFEEMINVYNRSKIVIGFARTSSKPKITSIKGRDFEVPICGTFYLCEYNSELCDWFVQGKEIIFWEDIQDLLKKVDYYLKHNNEREKVTLNAYNKCIAEHTWLNRLAVIFKTINR